MLKYVHGQFDEDRQKFHIVGGLLSHNVDTGWLEFRQTSQKKFTLAAIHEFVPVIAVAALRRDASAFTQVCYEFVRATHRQSSVATGRLSLRRCGGVTAQRMLPRPQQKQEKNRSDQQRVKQN